MPWKDPMSQRLELVALMEEGIVPVTELSRRFGVAPKTAYKWLKRYREQGVEGLRERSRAPLTSPGKTLPEVEAAVVAARRAHPLWGGRKVAAWLQKQHPDLSVPAPSTCHDIFVRHGLVSAPRRRRQDTAGRHHDGLTTPKAPNDVWTVDFKGPFRLGDRTRCVPLTLQDAHTRMLLRCDALPNGQRAGVRLGFERAFRRYGLPLVIRSDNGAPFAAPSGALGWSELTVWFHRLGITHERTRPASPYENGRHERMHRTLKKHTARPPAHSLSKQQYRFDKFRREYNTQRPHEALAMQTPAALFKPSKSRLPRELAPIVYPGHMEVRRVYPKGYLRWNKRSFYICEPLARQPVGLEEVDEGLWSVLFGDAWLGYIWLERPELGLIRPGSRAYEQLLPMYPDDL